MAQEKWI